MSDAPRVKLGTVHVPPSDQRERRTIIVGDVHGCRQELEALLDRLAFASGDQLVFVGDVVARGPDSLGVLDLVRTTGAVLVRGNHEQRLLDWRAAKASSVVSPTTRARPGVSTAAQPRARQPGVDIGKLHRDLARTLRPIDWTLLETSPVRFDLPNHGLTVVHAGLLPGVPLDEQRPDTMMRIRTVPPNALPSRAQEPARPPLWGACWQGPPQVVFGHNAAPGLQLHPWATGLDTGCVYGGKLTAMVLGEHQKVPRSLEARRALLVSEPARRIWWQPDSFGPRMDAGRRRS